MTRVSAPPRIRAKQGRTLTVEQARQLLNAANRAALRTLELL